MTKKSYGRKDRDRRGIPRKDNVASITINEEKRRITFTTNDMLTKQIQRDGPLVAKSFDRLTKRQMAECSKVCGRVQGALVRHLPRMDDDDFEATAARLLFSASNALVASIEVARHGYPRQYGPLARVMIETLATVVVLAIKKGALAEFHAGTLSSTKCVTWSKEALPPLGQYWGMLSNTFVHIGKDHADFEGPVAYKQNDMALQFVMTSVRGNVWLLDVVTDLVYSDSGNGRYWRRNGPEAWFEPTPDVQLWTEEFVRNKEPG